MLVLVCMTLGCPRAPQTGKECPAAEAGPDQVALAFAQALEEGKLREAYALTQGAEDGSLTSAQFEARYADAQARRARAEAIRASLSALHADSPGAKLVRGKGWRVLDAPGEAPGAVLARFLDAAEAGDFAQVYGLLASPLRARYTPATLERDFAAEPLAKERLSRARFALERQPPVYRAGAVEFPLAEGRAVRLVPEGGAYKVAAIE